MLFRYQAATAEKRYYDQNPLCYVLIDLNNVFYGMNLHYYPPNQRMAVINMLQEAEKEGVREWEKFLFGSTGFHKYLKSEVMSNYLDVAMDDWQTAIMLPAEDFVRTIRGVKFPVSLRSIW